MPATAPVMRPLMGLTQTRPSSHMPVASRRKLPAVRGERLDRVRMHVRRPKIPEATFSDPRLYMASAGGGHISCMLLAPLQKRFPHLLVPSITRWSRRFLRRMLRNPLTQLVRFRASIMAPTLQAMKAKLSSITLHDLRTLPHSFKFPLTAASQGERRRPMAVRPGTRTAG